MTAKIVAIAARSEDGFIGRNNQLPWRVKGDWQFFLSQSRGKPVVMGRKTFEAMGKPLTKSANLVITRNAQWANNNVARGARVFPTLDAAIAQARVIAKDDNAPEIIIGGGEEIYRQALPLTQRIYLTTIHCTVGDGDAKFPEFDPKDWIKTREEKFKAQKGDTADYTITVWDRK